MIKFNVHCPLSRSFGTNFIWSFMSGFDYYECLSGSFIVYESSCFDNNNCSSEIWGGTPK